ncbi:transcriptional repressor LexA [Paracoccaceae bacterium]|nr:transcriptional repressor LexA [Paracoccaceae bacterium]
MLTKKQHELLLFLEERISISGVTPSFEEMKKKVGLKSKSGIHRLISGLEERGFIKKLPFKARAIEILKSSNTKQISADNKITMNNDHIVELPIVGRIAAGLPIEAIESGENCLYVPKMLTRGSDSFVLEIKGDSMIDAGISDGDFAIIKKQSTANNGDIAVALTNENEATLKRFRKRGDTIALEAANEAFETRIYSAGQISIQGILIGLIRQY